MIVKRARYALATMAIATLCGCATVNTSTAPPLEAVSLRVNYTDTTFSLFSTIAQTYPQNAPHITLDGQLGTQETLITTLNQAENHYFLTSRSPNQPNLWGAPIAQDAIAIIVNPQNPIQSLSLDELRRIFLQNVTTWQELGGNNSPITLYSREEGADSRAEFERLVMGQRRTAPNALVLPSASATIERVAQELGAISYVPFSQLTPEVKAIAIEGISPSPQTILENLYPLRSMVYMVGQVEPMGEYRALIGWLQSLAGQTAISTQYVPLPR